MATDNVRGLWARTKRFLRPRTALGQAVLVAGFAAVLLLLIVVVLSLLTDKAHDIAETVGGIGAAVGTVFVAMTLFLQSRELELQRRELELQREEVRRTREELEAHGQQFRRQADVMERQLAKDAPRLLAHCVEDVQLDASIRYAIMVTNVGGAAITEVVAYKEWGDQMERSGWSKSLSPNQQFQALELDAPKDGQRSAALTLIRKRSVRLRVTFTDALGSPHAWKIPLAEFERRDELHYPPND